MTENRTLEKKSLIAWIDENKAPFEELALKIWEKPELPYQEHEAVRLQTEFLEKRGFRVTRREGLPTAFMAEWSVSPRPVVGILGEYDALGGLSQAVEPRIRPVTAGAPGHGCGHNLLGVGGLMAACAAKEVLSAQGLRGTIRYYGCPAEEELRGKGEMAKLGYFEGLDVALAWHPGDHSSVTDCTMTAMASAKFRFKGRAAHAGASPEAGRSALDAVELMNVGSNYVREHMLDQDRLHYVITKGGIAPNIVPAEAEVWYYIRAPHVDELGSLWKRLAKIAQGAAMMTETEVEHEILGGCYNTFPNKRLNRVLEENVLSFAGKIDFDDEDLRFARDVQQTLPRSQVAMTLAKMPLQENESVLNAAALPCFDSGTFVMGSTDVGDVAYIVPTSMIWGATWPLGVPNHSWQATACAGSSIGLKGMAFAAKALSGCIYDLVQNDSIVEEAKKEFALGMEGKTYRPLKDLLNASEDPNSAGGQGA